MYETISATITGDCPSGYTQNGGYCSIKITIDAKRK